MCVHDNVRRAPRDTGHFSSRFKGLRRPCIFKWEVNVQTLVTFIIAEGQEFNIPWMNSKISSKLKHDRAFQINADLQEFSLCTLGLWKL